MFEAETGCVGAGGGPQGHLPLQRGLVAGLGEGGVAGVDSHRVVTGRAPHARAVLGADVEVEDTRPATAHVGVRLRGGGAFGCGVRCGPRRLVEEVGVAGDSRGVRQPRPGEGGIVEAGAVGGGVPLVLIGMRRRRDRWSARSGVVDLDFEMLGGAPQPGSVAGANMEVVDALGEVDVGLRGAGSLRGGVGCGPRRLVEEVAVAADPRRVRHPPGQCRVVVGVPG